MDIGENKELQQQAEEIVNKVKPLFSQIQEIMDQLVEDPDIQNMSRYYRYLDILTGAYGSLNVEFKRLRAMKENEQAKYFNQLKLSADYDNKKFVAQTATGEASLYVGPLRMARDIIEGYVQAASVGIGTCKARIYDYQREKRDEVGA